jgi:putative molybdopterin biosynthesis protein
MASSPGIRLRYGFAAPGQSGQAGAEVEHPLFDLLAALQAQGSIRHTATALGRSYRHVWGELREWEATLGQPLVAWEQGKAAQLTPFAQRLLWAERQARTRMTPHLEAMRAELQRVLAQAQDETLQVLDIAASHDPALPALQTLAAQQGLHLSLRFTGSEDALRGLHDGRCVVAGFHVPELPQGSPVFARALKPWLKPGVHKLIGSHRREQGWLLRRGVDAPATLAALAAGGWRIAARQPGSGTRLLTGHLLEQAGLPADALDAQEALVEDTHVALASAIAAGRADIGLGVQAAAQAFDLAFVPLATERYFFVCLKPALETPLVQQLRAVLASPGWADALGPMAGQAPQSAGQVLSLTRALPWWTGRRQKRA